MSKYSLSPEYHNLQSYFATYSNHKLSPRSYLPLLKFMAPVRFSLSFYDPNLGGDRQQSCHYHSVKLLHKYIFTVTCHYGVSKDTSIRKRFYLHPVLTKTGEMHQCWDPPEIMLSEACGERVEGLEIQILSLLRSRHITLQLLNYNCTPSMRRDWVWKIHRIVLIDL